MEMLAQVLVLLHQLPASVVVLVWVSPVAKHSKLLHQPEVGGDVRTLLFITLAFIETLTIYGY